MSTKPKTVDAPDDPDPTPMTTANESQDAANATRETRKKAAANYGRSKTILAGNNSKNNEQKKTILGG